MMTTEQINALPRELKDLPQWVGWKRETKKGKTTKPPCNPETGYCMDGIPEKNHFTFTAALDALKGNPGKAEGIGFAFNENGISGIDIDHCIDQAGNITPEAREIVDRVNSYSEFSPSGTGLHIIVKGTIPNSERSESGYLGGKKGDFEAYSSGRYFTMTGNVFEGKSKIEERQKELEWFWKTFVKAEEEPKEDNHGRETPKKSAGPLSDDDILKIIGKAKNGAKVQDLMNSGGDSEGDAALINSFAFYTKEPEQIARLMRSTKRTREKWDEKRGKEDFLSYQIKRLLKKYQGGNYEPKLIPQKGGEMLSKQSGHIPFIFWFEDEGKKPALKISNVDLFDFLTQAGFCKMYPEGEKESILLRIQNNVVEEVTPEIILDHTHKYIASLPNQISENFFRETLEGILFNPCYGFFCERQLKKFLPKEINFHRDTRDAAYFYFKNGFVEATKKGQTFHDYKQLSGAIWNKWILPRDYRPVNDGKRGEVEQFFSILCNHDVNRLLALKTSTGYELHRFKDPSLTKAVIIVDEKISEEPEGGTGKSLVVICLSHIRNVAKIDGKDFDFDNRFAFQDVNWDTEIIAFDDVAKRFDFERLFHKITDGMEVERKGEHRFKIPRDKSPKFMLTTNYVIQTEGVSADRRKVEVEVYPYFGKSFTPREEFGHNLFDEWDTTEWNRFDQFMIDCTCEFLKHGLKTYQHVNLNERRVLQLTAFDFVQWGNDYFKIDGKLNPARIGRWIPKKELFDDFCNQFPDFGKSADKGKFSQHKFTSWLKVYASHNGFKVTEGRQRADVKPERCFFFEW